MTLIGPFLLSVVPLLLGTLPVQAEAPARIDRHALVSRHDIDWPSLQDPIPLGNGNFAFNADGTGLETFAGNTMSHWCWHNFPLSPGVTPDQIKPWATPDSGRLRGDTTKPDEAIYNWERLNPQPLNLGRLGFVDETGTRLAASDIRMESRHLELWSGLLTSRFSYRGQSVTVETCVDKDSDTVAVHVSSPLLGEKRLQVLLDFPAPTHGDRQWVGNFQEASGHRTEVIGNAEDRLDLNRIIDDARYQGALAGGALSIDRSKSALHQITLVPKAGADSLDFTCRFGPEASAGPLPSFAEVKAGCAASWLAFWREGGAIDLSGSKDPRWMELERRIVLSQYEMAVNSSGDNPPAEVGLTGTDSWEAKWHFEMIWWHLAHYALWDRWPMAEKALTIYQRISPVAQSIAGNFQYQGLMWPKSTGPNGYNDGYPMEMSLLWKEPHPIFFAELDYRLHPTPATLEKWRDIVFGTAAFMADYPMRNPATGQYDLVPVMAACEARALPRSNTIFELGYWRAGLEMAQQWRLRLGMGREAHWDEVASHLAPLPVKDGLYIYSDGYAQTYTNRSIDHLDMIGIAGMLPPFPGLDPDTAHRTVVEVARDWQWEKLWGWDFPWLAMAAARVGEPQLAIEALLNPAQKNFYDERGINKSNRPYFPGNGGLLYAVAMMAAGWDGAPDRPNPGFPNDGSWTVRWEDLKRAP